MTHQIENPWQTRGSREIYINPWIRVREDHVIRADGKDSIYGVVEFQNYALGIVPVTDNGDTFLVGQWRYPLDLYSWEIPEGGGPLSVSAAGKRPAGTRRRNGHHGHNLDRPRPISPLQFRDR